MTIMNEAHAMLQTLHEQSQKVPADIDENTVGVYHRTLDSIESQGLDVSAYRISDDEMQPQGVAPNVGNPPEHIPVRLCSNSLFRARIAAAIQDLKNKPDIGA